MKLKTGDNVEVIAGKDKGKSGKITNVLRSAGKVVIDGVNIRKKHSKARKQGEQGQILQIPTPIDVSNVMIKCSACKKNVRIGAKLLAEGKKIRVCKKCEAEL